MKEKAKIEVREIFSCAQCKYCYACETEWICTFLLRTVKPFGKFPKTCPLPDAPDAPEVK